MLQQPQSNRRKMEYKNAQAHLWLALPKRGHKSILSLLRYWYGNDLNY